MADPIPQGLAGYEPAPEQPGWPNLPDQGIPLVNAIATAQAMAIKREEIQGKLAQFALRTQALEQGMALKEQYFDLAKEKLGMQAEHYADVADMAERRQRDLEGHNAEMSQIYWARLDDEKKRTQNMLDKVKNQDEVRAQIGEYEGALGDLKAKSLSGQGPKIGTPEYEVSKAAIDRKYSHLWQYGGQKVYDDSEKENQQAKRDQAAAWKQHDDALKRELDFATKGKGGVTPYDLIMPETEKNFGHTGVSADQSWLAHDITTGKMVSPEEVAKNYKKNDPRLKFTTLYNWEWKKLRDHANEYLFPDGSPRTIGNMPATFSGPDPSKRVTVTDPNGRQFTLPETQVKDLPTGWKVIQ